MEQPNPDNNSASATPSQDGTTTLQSMIGGFNRSGLRPTQTVERHLPVVEGKPQPVNAALEDDEVREYFDSSERLEATAKEFANLLRTSKHCVVYTGAGISTAARIPGKSSLHENY